MTVSRYLFQSCVRISAGWPEGTPGGGGPGVGLVWTGMTEVRW
ncbi:hypothetical protein VDGD_21653 [Verticillium dahliae]|nr:hypothetical protein VDGD_21653 [Verticillium dahliae]